MPDVEGNALIRVVGVGGGGCNAINRMIEADIKGVEFIAVNTDNQALMKNLAPIRIHVGERVTRGLGAGGNPEVGERAAEETIEELREVLQGSDMVFVTCGMGGGTGTGATPVVARVAREAGALTIGVVTKPFSFEGSKRMNSAENGIQKLKESVDTLIVIPNDRLLESADLKMSLLDSFTMADDVLRQGIQGISEVITVPGLINLDFADVKTIMSAGGAALMAVGYGKGENRAEQAAKQALSSRLLDITIDGARGILFNVTGGSDLSLFEINQAASIIRETAHPDVNMIFGAVIDENMGDTVRVTVIATGFEHFNMPIQRRVMRERPAARQESARPAPAREESRSAEPAPRQEQPVESTKPIEEAPAAQPKRDFKWQEPQRNTAKAEDLDIPAFLRRRRG